MSSLAQTIIAAIGASGIIGLITTLIVTRVVQKSFERQDRREELHDQNIKKLAYEVIRSK